MSEELVSVYEGHRSEAEAIAAALRGSGIEVAVFGGLETSWHPGAADGAQVMVRAEDVPRARDIVEEAAT